MSGHVSRIGVVLAGAAAVSLAANGLRAQEVKIKTENGVRVVYNPKEPPPVKGRAVKVALKEDLTIGRDTEDPNYMFSGLQHMQVDAEEYMVVADWKETLIKIYDKTGKHVRSFGRKGQGPGEINVPAYVGIFQGNKIVIYDRPNGKFIFFSREGEFLKEVPKRKSGAIQRFKVDSEGNFYAISGSFDQGKITYELKKFSPAFEPLATLASFEETRTPQVVPAYTSVLFLQIAPDDSIAWLDPVKYEITVADKEGRVLRKIIKDWEPVKITEAHEKRLIQQTWGDRGVRPGIKFEIPKYFPPVFAFYIDDEGRIYVRTYDYITKDGVQLDRYDVFDPEGRYVAKFYHPRAETVQVFRKNKMYTRVEEEVYGIDVLRKYSLIWE